MRPYVGFAGFAAAVARPFTSLIFAIVTLAAAGAQTPSLDELVSGVVRVKTFINPDGRTIENLGREREGSGVVIDADGLIVTIGYLMVEAHAAEVTTADGHSVPADVVGYDHESGFGLLRATAPLKVRPMPLGRAAELKQNDPVLVASFGGRDSVGAARVASRREFAGSWEYLIEDAIFTTPPHPAWSGAALLSRDGKLAGIGSLIVGDALGTGAKAPGNMFVPIDRLPPILGDLIADGRVGGPGRPWLGLTTNDVQGRLAVAQVTPDGPAEKAGLRRGDTILAIAGERPRSLADFYRKLWALGAAGTVVPLEVEQDRAPRRVEVKSMNRLDHLRLKSTF
jgi:S1-C subfamily serine protease